MDSLKIRVRFKKNYLNNGYTKRDNVKLLKSKVMLQGKLENLRWPVFEKLIINFCLMM